MYFFHRNVCVAALYVLCQLDVLVQADDLVAYTASFTLSDSIDTAVYIRWHDFDLKDTTSWYYVGPLSAGPHSITKNTKDIGSNSYDFELGLYGTRSRVASTLSSISLMDGSSSDLRYNGNCPFDFTLSPAHCFTIFVSSWDDNYITYQSAGSCNDLRDFESTRYATQSPTANPTEMPTTRSTAEPDESGSIMNSETQEFKNVTVVSDNIDNESEANLAHDDQKSGVSGASIVVIAVTAAVTCISSVIGALYCLHATKNRWHRDETVTVVVSPRTRTRGSEASSGTSVSSTGSNKIVYKNIASNGVFITPAHDDPDAPATLGNTKRLEVRALPKGKPRARPRPSAPEGRAKMHREPRHFQMSSASVSASIETSGENEVEPADLDIVRPERSTRGLSMQSDLGVDGSERNFEDVGRTAGSMVNVLNGGERERIKSKVSMKVISNPSLRKLGDVVTEGLDYSDSSEGEEGAGLKNDKSGVTETVDADKMAYVNGAQIARFDSDVTAGEG